MCKNKGILIKNGVGKPWRGSFHALSLIVRSMLRHPQQEEAYFINPSRRKEEFLLSQQQPSQ